MTESAADDRGSTQEAKLPRRDWILLPLLSLLTICLLAGSTELIARRMFSESLSSINDCLIMDDPSTGVRAIPNSVCTYKIPEGQPVDYGFNSSGYRADQEYAPKPPGTYRIVMTGSSLAMGWGVPREKTFAALLPAELSRQTGRKVELYNHAMMYEVPHIVDLRFNQTLAARPDLILWIVTYWDIQNAATVAPVQIKPIESSAFMGRTRRRLHEALAAKSIAGAVSDLESTVRDLLSSTKSEYLLRHFSSESQSQYIRSHLDGPEAVTLKVEPCAEWQSNLLAFDTYAADIEGRARAAGVPLAVVLVPWRVQAAMLGMGEFPKGYNPYKLDDEMRSIVATHGGIYIDILPDFRTIPNPEQNYFPVDGHPDVDGHAMIAGFLAKALINGTVPGFSIPAQAQVAQGRAR
jgi:hypothetical protein